MLSTRNPELLRRLCTNFDALFNILNILTASLCLGASFGFDERAAAFLLVPFPLYALVVFGDATVSDVEFDTRRYFLLVTTLLPVTGACVVGRQFVCRVSNWPLTCFPHSLTLPCNHPSPPLLF